MKILFYDTKPYDKESFSLISEKYADITIDFVKTDISRYTVNLSKGYDAVCVFVASDVNPDIIMLILLQQRRKGFRLCTYLPILPKP